MLKIGHSDFAGLISFIELSLIRSQLDQSKMSLLFTVYICYGLTIGGWFNYECKSIIKSILCQSYFSQELKIRLYLTFLNFINNLL